MMNFRMPLILVSLGLFGLAFNAQASGELSENHILSSSILDYDLQYRVYVPEHYESLDSLPVIYVTDGQSYIRNGELHLLMDKEIAEGRIEPVIAVFVDARDPHKLDHNRRNSEFFCNQKYADFFSRELLPKIDSDYKTRKGRQHRVILGLSFGGLNSACFGLLAAEAFAGIAMQSPALHPVINLFELYERNGLQPLNIFLSTGSVNDNTSANRKWRRHLEKIGYEVTYRETREGHNWRNWRRLQDDVLWAFFGTDN
jgi:enterochelin esterase-like enzyme